MEWVLTAALVAALVGASLFAINLQATRRRVYRLEHQLAAERETERQLAATAERARIAREMHDVVAHTLSVVVAQADGGRFAAKADPASAAKSLDIIAEVSRAALTEMRALLGLLRMGDEDAALGPQPSLDDIPALVSATREGGLECSFVTTGTPRTLPIGAGLALYRITQEGLTNVLKHAGPKATTYVQLTWMDDAVELWVSDNGRGAGARDDGEGQGIAGMKERATVLGGTVSAGPRAGGGFVVKVRLPLAASTTTALSAQEDTAAESSTQQLTHEGAQQ
ncbi:histidine kinase [Demequina sp. B12]|uniref:sensor histidine kinase n=1 Tax=Demequina sp. B12 TaxID=2992757 RepID=UPI00237A9EE1|nr:histidine kinase [Demequina sp. B12]MDE0571947.1 histidine kinase [Demequina sp. B12]